MRGIMHVETAPASAEAADAYHDWYEAHIREIAEVDGVVAVHRYASLDDGGGRSIAIYELVGDDLEEVAARITAGASSRTPPPDGVLQLDPPPTVRYFELISEYDPAD